MNSTIKKTVFAVAAHPDDIEFMMAGTLLLLGEAGYQLHYMNVANGSCGSAVMDAEQTVTVRAAEARSAAAMLGATFHEPLVDDLQIYYTPELTAKLCAIVRQVNPEILLIPSPQDYMEDHMNVSRLMVTAGFCRSMMNFPTSPSAEPVCEDLAVYHALPYGLRDQLRNSVKAELYVNVSSVIAKKREILACHQSQKQWLDESQGLDSYLKTMEDMTSQVGRMSGKFEFAEGWRRHSHLGFSPENFDPLSETLKDSVKRENTTGERQ